MQLFAQNRYGLSFEKQQTKFCSTFKTEDLDLNEKWAVRELYWLLEGRDLLQSKDPNEEQKRAINRIKKKISSLWGNHFQDGDCESSSSDNHCLQFLRSLSHLIPGVNNETLEVLFLPNPM